MASIKRINLCFDIERLDDKRVYEMLLSKRNKTAYITEIIIAHIEKNKVDIDTEIIKQAFKEVLYDLNITTNMNVGQYQNNNEDIDIPEDVFNIISNI